MDIPGDWASLFISLSLPLLIGVFAAKRGRKTGLVVLWIYLWAIAGHLAIVQWHFHQQWLTLLTQARGIGYGASFLANTSAGHNQLLRQGVAEVIVIVVLTVIWYGLDRRKERIAGKSIQAA